MLCRQDDGSQYPIQHLSFLHQRAKFCLGDNLGFAKQAKPIETLASFLLRDAKLVNEIGATFSRLGLFYIRPNRARGAEVLLAHDPTGAIFLFLQVLIELDGAECVRKRSLANFLRPAVHDVSIR